MAAPHSIPTMAVKACAPMVEAATKSIPPAPTPANPNWDAMAASFAALSNSLAFGSAVLAVIALVAGLAWGKIVTANAEREARDMAKLCAEAYIEKWLANEAPGIIRERVDLILDATLGGGDDADAADEIGENAG